MKLCTCLLLLKIFALTNCITRIIRAKNDHRIIRPPVETVAGNSSEVFRVATKNLDNAHSFVARVTDGKDNLQLVFPATKFETFTDFIQETVDILNTYELTAFKDFFRILDTEIRKYHYKGCRFSELMQNHNTRSLLAGALTTVRENSATFTKANINEIADILRDKMYDENVKELLKYINSLYRNYEPEFRRVLNNLNNYTKSKSMDTYNDLVQIIKDGVRSILFNHYTELDTNTRRELKEKIENFWEKNKKSFALNDDVMNSVINRDSVGHSVTDNIQRFKTIKDKIEEHEQAYINDPKNVLRKKKKIVSKQINIDQSENKYENSIESQTPASDDSTEEFSSGQSLDTSNSIKQSQERYKLYNTQRYMTLYTEEISYKSRTTTKTEIIPISEKVITTRPKVHRRSTTTRYRPRNVSPNRKKKIKKLRTNHDMDDTKQDISSDSSQDSMSGLMLESKHRPTARVQSDKQRHAAGTTAVLRSQYDAVIDVQLSNTEMLKSLKRKDKKGAMQSKSVPTKTKIPHPYMRSQNDNQLPKLNAKSKELNFTLRKSIQPQFNKTFEDYVQKKILSLEMELTKLKQLSYLGTSLTNNDTDEVDVRNVTDSNETKNQVDDGGNYLRVNNLMQNYYHLTKGQIHIANNKTVKTESTTYTHKPSKPKVVKNDTDNATDIVNDTKFLTNVNTFYRDTEDLSKEFIRNNMTSSDSTVDVKNATRFESVVTAPTAGITGRVTASSEPTDGQIIPYKNLFDHVNIKLKAKTKM